MSFQKVMDVVDYVVKSKEMESLRSLCAKLNVDYRVILKDPKDGISATVGSISRNDSEEIVAESVPAEPPIICVPNLPFSYEELFRYVLLVMEMLNEARPISLKGRLDP